MKKRVHGRKLSRGSGARRALFRSLIRALVSEGSIVTTQTKAKIIKQQVEKLVSLAKKGELKGRRRVYSVLGNDRVSTDILFNKIAPNFKDRIGGYIRVVKLPRRRGDAAEMARIEWVKEVVQAQDRSHEKTKVKKKRKKKLDSKIKENVPKRRGIFNRRKK